MTGRLHPADVELIARRVVELLRVEPRGSVAELIDAAEVARRFGVSARWVRDHAADLGAVRLGDGARPRLRFDAETVAAAMKRRSGDETSEGAGSHGPKPDRADPGARPRGSSTGSLPPRELQPRRIPRNRGGAAATARPTAQGDVTP